jgi:predicted deacetylase
MSFPFVVSIHDVAPSTATAVRTWSAHLDARGVPATLLVIPGPWEGPPLRDDPELLAWLRDRAALRDEIAQHGWTHRRVPGGPRWRRCVGAVAARGCAEFAAVDGREATRRLSWGRGVLTEFGLEPAGFTPPGWLASPATLDALRTLGYRYTTSHGGVTDLQRGRRIRSLAWSHRPGAATETLGAAVLAAGVRRVARAGQPLRLALHPADLASPALVTGSLRAIDAALDCGALPCTYLDLVAATATGVAA